MYKYLLCLDSSIAGLFYLSAMVILSNNATPKKILIMT